MEDRANVRPILIAAIALFAVLAVTLPFPYSNSYPLPAQTSPDTRTIRKTITQLRKMSIEQLQEKLEASAGTDKIPLLIALSRKFDQDRMKEALSYAHRALELARESEEGVCIFFALSNVGACYYLDSRFREAVGYYLESLEYQSTVEDKDEIANVMTNIGSVLTDLGRYREARRHLEKALEIAVSLKENYRQREIYLDFIELDKETGNYKAVLEYSKRCDVLYDSLYNETSDSEISRLEVRYDAEKKEHEIRLLRKRGEIRRLVHTFLAIALLLSLGVALLLYNRYRVRRKANYRLWLVEERYHALFDHAAEAILLSDDNGYIDCNKKAPHLFGVTREQLLGCTFADLSPPKQPDGRDSLEKGLELRNNALLGETRQFYWQYMKKDGTPIDAMISLTPVTINRRTIIQVIVHDIGDRKQLEEERVKSAKLETTTLLAGGVAHDFNNLLTIIRGNLDMAIEDAPGDSNLKSLLLQMEKTVQSAITLAGNFLTISEGGFMPGEYMPIKSILQEAVDSFREDEMITSYTPGIRINSSIPGDLRPLKCVPGQIRQLMLNVIRNAVEAVRAAGRSGVIEITAANVVLNTGDVPALEPGRYLSIIVTDNGEGISPDHLSRIFDPYFTTRDDVTRKGAGMGLAVAQAIVKRHHGAIDVSSQPGKNTTVQVYFPAGKAE
jgi:PAS domain S-box-containing protein